MAQLLRRISSSRSPLTLLPRRLGSQLAAYGPDPLTEEALPPLPEGWPDNLYNRVAIIGDPRLSVIPVLELWVREGKPVVKKYLQGMIKGLQVYRRYNHALEISMWMSDRRFFYLTPGDVADRLNLIKKCDGLEQAESYFSNIPKQLKLSQVYGALLNCYVEDKCLEKAEALFQKMEETKMLTTFGYNKLIKLYNDIEYPAKAEAIFEEMKTKKFIPDYFTYSILLEGYAASANVEGMKKVLESMDHSGVAANWYIYAVAAQGHVKAGLIEEALILLNKSKERIPERSKGRVACGYLLTLYADLGKKDEVFQMWEILKSSQMVANSSYRWMISGLVKLNDLDRAEAIFEEWESVTTRYDYKVMSALLEAYIRGELIGKAELLVGKAVESGKLPFADAMDRLAALCFRHGHSLKAVKMMKRALTAGEAPWKPDPTNVSSMFEYLKEQRDVEEVEGVLNLLRHQGLLSRELYESSMEIYVSAGKPTTSLLDQMRKDGFEFNEDEEDS